MMPLRSFPFLLILPLSFLSPLGVAQGENVSTQHQDVLPVYGAIPDFQLIRETGSPVALSDLKGKIWIANFIFTRCAGVCPLMSNRMRALQDVLTQEAQVRFISFSVDPEYDTADVLSSYSERFKSDPAKWFFLTGDKQMIYALSEQHFHLGVSEIPEKEREALDQSVRHSSKFVLVDRDGKIRGYYDSDSDSGIAAVIRDARLLLEEKI